MTLRFFLFFLLSSTTALAQSDFDGDGLFDSIEDQLGTSNFDQDSDDDGVGDGDEYHLLLTNPLLLDTDGDGLQDGTEAGYISGMWGNPSMGVDGTDWAVFIPDADPLTTTDPLERDTDGGRRSDGKEDANHDGLFDPATETDPNNGVDDLPDADGDGLPDSKEIQVGTDPMDRDTDDDGLSDLTEFMNHHLDATSQDSDGDGVQDGTEVGISAPVIGDSANGIGGTNLNIWIPDADPSTTTSPFDADSDDGGASDGQEDLNHNGKVDGGESNPNDSGDDVNGVYVAPLTPGQPTTISAWGLSANTIVTPCFSLAGPGTTQANNLGVVFGLAKPITALIPFTITAQGNGSNTYHVPHGVKSGRQVWFQGYVKAPGAPGVVTGVVYRVVE